MLLLTCNLIWVRGLTRIGWIGQSYQCPLTVSTVIKVDGLVDRVTFDGTKLILFIIHVT